MELIATIYSGASTLYRTREKAPQRQFDGSKGNNELLLQARDVGRCGKDQPLDCCVRLGAAPPLRIASRIGWQIFLKHAPQFIFELCHVQTCSPEAVEIDRPALPGTSQSCRSSSTGTTTATERLSASSQPHRSAVALRAQRGTPRYSTDQSEVHPLFQSAENPLGCRLLSPKVSAAQF